MEQRLAQYRARKQKVQQEPGQGGTAKSGEPEPASRGYRRAAKEKILSLYSRWRKRQNVEPPNPQINNQRMQVHERSPSVHEDASDSLITPAQSPPFYVILLLKFLLWLVLFGLFVELEFGLVYFVLSMFYWLYEGTRGAQHRKQGEMSAYSVFNPGCEAIEGTLTAEQFERELQYRPLAGR
ncbi:SAY domain-containing 1 [Pelobates cultripes]|uniref:SAY domain-containing 1 n=1 Tax=Pelobates cultripes TaxID=61616 RepID=A0AAD1RIR8_PELCU|nr:SAY domain-containing 1 [Pelobates cultripes]